MKQSHASDPGSGRFDRRRRSVGAGEVAAARGAIAVLAPVHDDAMSLVIRSGWSAIPRVISSLGGRVVAIERRWQELVYAREAGDPDRETYIQVQRYAPLPFCDEAFDCVFMVDRSSALGAEGTDGDGLGARAMMLREAFRVLKPGGSLVLESPNRFSFLNVIGKSDVGAARGRAELVPRLIAGWSWRLRRRANAVPRETLSHRGYVRALRRAGFERIERFVPWPDRRVWYWLWPDPEASATPLVFGDRLRDRAARLAFAVLRVLRAQATFVPDYIHTARKSGTRVVERPAVVDFLLSEARLPQQPRPLLRLHRNSGSLTMTRAARFYKLPLSRSSRERLRQEEETLRDLADHPIRAFAIRPHAFRREGGVYWAVYPLARAPETEERMRLARLVLSTLIDNALPAPLSETDAWRRIFGPASAEYLRTFPAGARLMEGIRRRAGDRVVPVGRTHGDFHLGNVLVGEHGEPVVIDWDHSDPHSPVFLDVFAAAHHHAFNEIASGPGQSHRYFMHGWGLQLHRDDRLAFRPEVERCRGDLDPGTMLALDILNKIGWVLSGEHSRENRVETHRSWIALAARAMGIQ